MQIYSIHYYDALRRLEDGKAHKVEFWKLQNGEIVQLEDAVCISQNWKARTHNLRLPNGQVRRLRNITIRKIDDMEVYL